MNVPIAACAAAVLLVLANAAAAQESRAFNPIARPAAPAVLPSGAVRVSPPIPVSRERVEGVVQAIANAWTGRRLESVLSERFPGRQQLADTLALEPQKDAALRITAIQGWQVVEQYRLSGALVTKLSITVRTQVEFNDAADGFQRRDGTNEYVVTLRGRGDQP